MQTRTFEMQFSFAVGRSGQMTSDRVAQMAAGLNGNEEITESESEQISGGALVHNHNESADPNESEEVSEAEADDVSGGALSPNHNESADPNESEEVSEAEADDVSGGGLVVGTLHT